MYWFEWFLGRNVVVTTKNAEFRGMLVEHDSNEEVLISWGRFAYCLLSTSDGMIEIPDKDIMSIE